jgi:hypothetical protein
MKRILMALVFISALMLGPGSATALSGDCNNDGQVDQADLDALMDSLNTSSENESLANCDYNNDGGIGLDDVGAHLKGDNS